MMTPALAPDDFEEALRAHAKHYHHQHPFHRRMNDGGSSREEIRGWVVNRFYYQVNIPRKDASILSSCPDREIRRRWVRRIIDHDGTTEGSGGIEAWLRLGEAVGLTREEIEDERHLLPGVRFAVDAYVTFARTRPWIEGVAAGLTELFAPGLMRRRIAAMRTHYPWIASDGLEYFSARIEITPTEGAATLGMVVEHCGTREQQLAAIAALAFKCDVLR